MIIIQNGTTFAQTLKTGLPITKNYLNEIPMDVFFFQIMFYQNDTVVIDNKTKSTAKRHIKTASKQAKKIIIPDRSIWSIFAQKI